MTSSIPIYYRRVKKMLISLANTVVSLVSSVIPFRRPTETGLAARVAALEERIDAQDVNRAVVKAALLEIMYQKKQDMEDLIILYNSVDFTHVTLADGSQILITEWLPTVASALVYLNDAIDAVETT